MQNLLRLGRCRCVQDSGSGENFTRFSLRYSIIIIIICATLL